MKDRIIKFITTENITSTKFADEIGVQRSSVSHILSGRNNPSFEFIQKILTRYKRLNADWLILGNEPMYKNQESATLFSTSPVSSAKVIQNDLFQKPIEPLTSPELNKSVPPVIPTEISSSRKVEKIVIFYSDKTFAEFLPS
ncbi:MAG: helix-turn-helix transcriptional regulator [Bacteroidota bacterium]|nr:helix-turn-helix transcriptional regulator [Bacteroidota bacterium]